MKLDGDVVPHPPSSPAKQTSLLIEERREPSDEAGLNGPRMASPACPSNKEREQEFSNKNEKGNIEKEKKKNKKGGKEERNKLKKIRKENKRQRRRKRKLEKEKAIAHTLLLLRMPETVPDAEQVCTIHVAVSSTVKADIPPLQKKDDGSASSPAVSDVAVPNTEQVCFTRPCHRLLRKSETDIHFSLAEEGCRRRVRGCCFRHCCFRGHYA